MTDQHEVEDKYDVDPDAVLPDLATLPGVATVDEPVEQRLRATYFDTTSLRLLAAGITLRRRTGGEDEGWHLKLPAEDGRHELGEPLGGTGVPTRFTETLRVVTRGEPLAPLATIRTHRTAHKLRDGHGTLLGEVADDRVSAARAARGGVPAGDAGAWREWELELAHGDRSLLEAAAHLLGDAGARPAEAGSKLARAVADLAPGPRAIPPAGGDEPVSAVVHARLTEQIEELRRRDPQVRADLPDGVHKMRVAIRRLRSALATARPFLDRAVTEPLRRELKWLADVLAPARDAEVQRDRLAAALADHPGAPAAETARTRTEAGLGERYEAAHRAGLHALDSARYVALLDRLDALVASPPWSPAAASPVDDAYADRIRHDWKRVERRVKAAAGTDGEERARRLHEVRKAVKRVRYAVEAVVPIHGSDAARTVEVLEEIQTVLGDHHDTVLARSLLVELSAGATAAGENAFPYGAVHRGEGDVAAQLDAAFERLWRSASKKPLAWLP